MAQSPDGTLVASLAADEELRIWKLFESSRHQEENIQLLSVNSPHITIR
jgi:WD40 repeat protein